MPRPNKQTQAALDGDTDGADELEAKVSKLAPDDATDLEIDLEEDDDGGDDDDDEPAATADPHAPPARVRRRNNYQKRKEERDDALSQLEEERRQRRQLEEQLHQQRLQAPPQQQPTVHQQVEHESQRLYQAKVELYRIMQAEEAQAGHAGLSEERRRHYHEQARSISRAELRLEAFALEAESAPRKQAELTEHYVKTNHADIYSKPEAVRAGLAIFNHLVHVEGMDPNSHATIDEAAKRVRDVPRFALKKSPPADKVTTARLSAGPRSAPSGKQPQGNGKIVLKPSDQRMALSLYSDDTPEVAYRKMAKQLQKRAAKKAAAGVG
jgi:hypothetical protein